MYASIINSTPEDYSIPGGNESTICEIGECSQQRFISSFVNPNKFNIQQVKSTLHFSVNQ